VGEQAPGDGGTSELIRPQRLWRGRDGWGVVHYGLLFDSRPVAYAVRSALGTRLEGLPTRRAEVGRWRLVDLAGTAGLFLPRRWLIASGRLTPLAALMPWLRFRLDPRVLDEFWLELRAPVQPPPSPLDWANG
jgi:hypothetical protein